MITITIIIVTMNIIIISSSISIITCMCACVHVHAYICAHRDEGAVYAAVAAWDAATTCLFSTPTARLPLMGQDVLSSDVSGDVC